MNRKPDVVIITGAGGEIGRACAEKLAKENYNLALFDKDEFELLDLVNDLEKHEAEIIHFCGNVADENFVVASVGQVLARFNRIDHLINNAALKVFEEFSDSSLYDLKNDMDKKVIGVYNFSRAVISQMIENNAGSIINVALLSGKSGFTGGTVFSTAKDSVMDFTKTLLHEVNESGIRIAAVCPGSVSTDMILNIPLNEEEARKITTPKELADIISKIISLPIKKTYTRARR